MRGCFQLLTPGFQLKAPAQGEIFSAADASPIQSKIESLHVDFTRLK
jgi:hypothetical protein